MNPITLTTTVTDFVKTINEALKAAAGQKFGREHGHVSEIASRIIAPLLPAELKSGKWFIGIDWQTTQVYFDRAFAIKSETNDDKRCSDYNKKGTILSLHIEPFMTLDSDVTLAQYIDILKLYKLTEKEDHILTALDEAKKNVERLQSEAKDVNNEIVSHQKLSKLWGMDINRIEIQITIAKAQQRMRSIQSDYDRLVAFRSESSTFEQDSNEFKKQL